MSIFQQILRLVSTSKYILASNLYLDYNKYFDDLEPFYEMSIEEAFNENDFDSYDIANMIECHSNCLSNEEWEIYNQLEND